MRPFWPASESAQKNYETLRQAVLAGGQVLSIAGGSFERRGLAGLIAWPTAEPVFSARFTGAIRPPWTPHHDPRLEALAAAYEMLLALPGELTMLNEGQQ
ncbi:MAG: hypothetical protein ACT4OM_00765 [Actinomycetota bacterium]